MNEMEKYADELLAKGKKYGEVATALQEKYGIERQEARQVIFDVEHKGGVK